MKISDRIASGPPMSESASETAIPAGASFAGRGGAIASPKEAKFFSQSDQMN